ncbi:MAG: hypothetical protein NTV68_05545 [Methanomicrobiales archaeon]|nr:hypothetical protein [Methanomicrobiales archaeon]
MKLATLHSARNFRDAIHRAGPNEEVIDTICDAIRLHLDDRIESGEKIPQAHLIN